MLKFNGNVNLTKPRELQHKPELLVHPIVKHAPLIIRDALYGGGTEAMLLHCMIREGE